MRDTARLKTVMEIAMKEDTDIDWVADAFSLSLIRKGDMERELLEDGELESVTRIATEASSEAEAHELYKEIFKNRYDCEVLFEIIDREGNLALVINSELED